MFQEEMDLNQFEEEIRKDERNIILNRLRVLLHELPLPPNYPEYCRSDGFEECIDCVDDIIDKFEKGEE